VRDQGYRPRVHRHYTWKEPRHSYSAWPILHHGS